MSEILFCSVFRGRNEEVVKNIRNHSPYVDKTLIILHGNAVENKQNIEFFESQECKDLNLSWELVDVPYSPEILRNSYLHKMVPGNWCLQLDCDEFLELPACYQLRTIVKQSEEQGINRIAFNAHDIRVGFDGAVWDHQTSYFNPLFIKIFPGTGWVGETHGGIHTPNVAPRIGQVPYRYFHIKTTASEYLRGCRNYWTTGESAQNNTAVPEWQEFKRICRDLQFESFDALYPKMVAGDLPEELKQWIILNRNNQNPEARSWFVVYFGLLHPEENTYLAGNTDLTYDKTRKAHTAEMTY